MMHGAGETLPPLFNTISLRDDRQTPEILASTRARYPISGHLCCQPVWDRGLIWALPRRFLSWPPTLQQIPVLSLGPRGIFIFCAERTPRQCSPGLIGDFKGIREDAALVPLLFVGLGLRLLKGDRSQWPTVGDVCHLAVCLSEYRSKRVFRHAVLLRFEHSEGRSLAPVN